MNQIIASLFAIIIAILIMVGQPVRAETNPLLNLRFWINVTQSDAELVLVRNAIDAGWDVNESADFFSIYHIKWVRTNGMPLHHLVRVGDEDTSRHEQARIDASIRMLIDAGAKIDAQNYKRNTPLHEAFQNGTVGTINFLIDAGADQTIKNEDGYTPYDLIFQRNLVIRPWFYVKNFFRFTKNLDRISAKDLVAPTD